MVQNKPQSLPDNFNFYLFGAGTKAPFRGYISSIDPTIVGAGVLIGGSQNVYKTLSEAIFVRPGLKRRGTPDATLAGVTSSFDWYTSLATVRPLRVVLDTASGKAKLQVESDLADGSTLVWYDLLTNLDQSRFVFDTWWDASQAKDIVLFVYGTPDMGSWSGAMGKISSTTSNTVVLTTPVASAGFANTAGSLLINGNTYTFTGLSGSTFTGVTPDPTGEAAGSVVIEVPVINSNTPASGFNADFLKVIGNQVNVGSYTSQFIYVSDQSDYTDYSVPTPRVPGSPDLLTLGSLARGITVQKGSTDRSGNAVIAGGLGDWYTILRSNITVGTDLTEQVDVIQTQTADLSTALAHEFIDLIGDTIIFLDQNNQLRTFGLVRNIVSPVLPLLSLDVFTELKSRDFTGGALRVVEDEGDTTVYITCPVSGIDYMYQVRERLTDVGNVQTERLWQPPQVRGISRIAVLDGMTFGYSSTNPQIYQLWQTDQYFDDGPFVDEQLPYSSHMVLAYLSLGKTIQMNFDKLYFEGYMTLGTILYASTYLEYQGSKNILTTTINKATNPGMKKAAFFGSADCPVPGESTIGNIEVGDGILPPDTGSAPLSKFRAMRRIQSTDVFEAAIDIWSEDADAQWGILLAGINMQGATRQPTFIMA